MEFTQVLLKPLITEKTTFVKEGANQVAFLVHPRANKLEIKQAVVKAVNVVRKAPANRERQGRVIGRKPGWKKAYVTLAEGAKIEFFEGV